MKYIVDPAIFDLAPNLEFGIILATDLKVTPSNEADQARFIEAQEALETRCEAEEIRSLPTVAAYREVLQKAGINPNKFTPSVEAMLKRVAKGNRLPFINALVDLANAVSIEQTLSLGGHDLNDIKENLEVRFSRPGDMFLPFGETQWEAVEAGEMVFASGHEVQTRKWVWRQSELGKVTTATTRVFFQLAGFAGDPALDRAMAAIEQLVVDRLGGKVQVFRVNRQQPEIEFIRPEA